VRRGGDRRRTIAAPAADEKGSCSGRISAIKPNPEKCIRYDLKKCGDCKKQFTVRMGTIFEESKLLLHIWLQTMHLMYRRSANSGVLFGYSHRGKFHQP
jgi:hypothetical protein